MIKAGTGVTPRVSINSALVIWAPTTAVSAFVDVHPPGPRGRWCSIAVPVGGDDVPCSARARGNATQAGEPNRSGQTLAAPAPRSLEQLQDDDHQDDHYQHADDRANQSPIHAQLLSTGASCRADRILVRYLRKRAGCCSLAAGERATRGWNCQAQRFHLGDADAPNGSRVSTPKTDTSDQSRRGFGGVDAC